MIINKEKNFVSAVLYTCNNESIIVETLKKINKVLYDNFEKYEIICVNDCSTDNSVNKIREFADSLEGSIITILNMSFYQGMEFSMNAGVDLAIGDFVFEFDSAYMNYNIETIMEVYNHSLKGFDIVSAAPKNTKRKSSKMFYRLYNSNSHNPNKLKTESFRILSRRAINRVHSMNKTIPYRKAIYANSGLKIDTIYYKNNDENQAFNKADSDIRKNVAVDSLILFTDVAYKFSITMTILMMIGIIIVSIYTIYIFAIKQPVAGWTTTMLFLAVGFFGIFGVLAIIVKYLTIIVDLIFKKQKYMIESIEKISK